MDILGRSIKAYFETGIDLPVRVWINDVEDTPLKPSLFFRKEPEFSAIEQAALLHCRGQVLDAGAGAGCHSLVLQERGFQVTALDHSAHCCEVMEKRGVKHVVCSDLMTYSGARFDTIVLLMNGFGLAGSEEGLSSFLTHLKSLLNPGGAIIGESTDVFYMYHNGRHDAEIDLSAGYYGDVTFVLRDRSDEVTFPWTYPDEHVLEEVAASLGFQFEIIERGDRHNFLCSLTLI